MAILFWKQKDMCCRTWMDNVHLPQYALQHFTDLDRQIVVYLCFLRRAPDLDPSASTFQVLEIQACTVMLPSIYFKNLKCASHFYYTTFSWLLPNGKNSVHSTCLVLLLKKFF